MHLQAQAPSYAFHKQIQGKSDLTHLHCVIYRGSSQPGDLRLNVWLNHASNVSAVQPSAVLMLTCL
jgi:hypothetical protein